MKTILALSVFVCALAYVIAGDTDYVVPPQFEAEGTALLKKFEDAKVPKMADGKCYDMCKAPDALKAEGLAFAAKVNAAGGKIPIPTC